MTQMLTYIGEPRIDEARKNTFMLKIQIPGAIMFSNWKFMKG